MKNQILIQISMNSRKSQSAHPCKTELGMTYNLKSLFRCCGIENKQCRWNTSEKLQQSLMGMLDLGLLMWPYLNHYLTTKGKGGGKTSRQSCPDVLQCHLDCWYLPQHRPPARGGGPADNRSVSSATRGGDRRNAFLCLRQQLRRAALAYNPYSCVFPFDCVKQLL